MQNKYLISIGEALIDFIPNKSGCSFDDVDSFSPCLGGGPVNVCGAFTKLGGKSRLISQVGDDPFGHKIVRLLKKSGVDTQSISLTTKANTALAFVSLEADGNRTFSFYRNPSADMLLCEDQIKIPWFDDIFALHFSSVSIGNFPMKNAHKKAISIAKKQKGLISFDPNLRFMLWNDKKLLKNAIDEFMPYADLLKISDEELNFICGTHSIENAVEQLFKKGVKLIVYTCGSKGAYAFTKNAHAFSNSQNVKALDTTGAGDGFISSFLWNLLENGKTSCELINCLSNSELKKYLDFSNKFCALSIQQKGGFTSYPSFDEVK